VNVYIAKFKGHYPVGGEAVVVGETKRKATNALNRELKKQGLEPVKPDALELLDPNIAEVYILNNGDY
jgi:hypothetical protein